MSSRILVQAKDVQVAKQLCKDLNIHYTTNNLYDYFNESLNTVAFFFEKYTDAVRIASCLIGTRIHEI